MLTICMGISNLAEHHLPVTIWEKPPSETHANDQITGKEVILFQYIHFQDGLLKYNV